MRPHAAMVQAKAQIGKRAGVQLIAAYSSSQPSAIYFGFQGTNWYLIDFLEWKFPKIKNKKLLGGVGFKKFAVEVGMPLRGSKIPDGDPVTFR